MEQMIIAGLIIVAIFIVTVIGVIKSTIYICQPNEVLIFSGGKYFDRLTGQEYGYRLIRGGRAYKKPLIERVDRMDLSNMAIDVNVSGAYSRGGIPLNVEGVANVKIDSGDNIHNAIERFLGKSNSELEMIIKVTLEGNLRGVLAKMTPEEINTDKVEFTKQLIEEAGHDFSKLGLKLDTLNIKNISDDKGYLDALGRKFNADLQKVSYIAEASAKADSKERSADNKKQTLLAQIESQVEIAKADTKRRIMSAKSQQNALIAEEKSKVASAIAKANAELELQKARIEQVRRLLEADIIKPAIAEKDAMEASAKGGAAKTIEDGKAQAEVLGKVIQTWKGAGTNAKGVFLMQKLEPIVKLIVETINHVQIKNITLLDNASDRTPGGDNLPMRLTRNFEQLKASTGIDVPGIVKKLTDKGTGV